MAFREAYPALTIERKYGPWLTAEEMEIVKTVRDYMQEQVKPRVWELECGMYKGSDGQSGWDARDELASPLVKMGLQRMGVPVQYGGLGLSMVCKCAIGEEMCRVDLPLNVFIGKAGWMAGPIFSSKNELLKKMLAEKICGDDLYVGAVGFTEPQGGVSVEDIVQHCRTINTMAVMDGNEYVINGQKVFPGPAGPAELFKRKILKGHLGYLMVATTEPRAEKRNWDSIGLFLIPPDAKGLTFSGPYMKMGNTLDRNCNIFMDDVRIPKEYRVAGPGMDAALYYANILAGARLGEAARIVGGAQGLFDRVLEYTGQREIEGRPLREYSMFAGIIGEMAEKIMAARAMYMYGIYCASHPELYGYPWDQDGTHAICSGARDVAGRAFRWIRDKAFDLFGGYGYCCETGIEKISRDQELIVLGPGGPQRDQLDMALLFYPRTWSGKAQPFERWRPGKA